LNTAGETAADPQLEVTEGVSSGEELKQDAPANEGDDNNRGEDCEESTPMPSRKLENVLGESSVTGANDCFERTWTSSAEDVKK
jgi:hypothetical protein